MSFLYFVAIACCTLAVQISASDITIDVFGNHPYGVPAAFADFNSDDRVDIFIIDDGGKTLHVMLASDEKPFFCLPPDCSPSIRIAPQLNCQFPNKITSVVPGDFDSDQFMDILVTTSIDERETQAYILWGNDKNITLSCPNDTAPWLTMIGQPLAIDFNQDMIIDLFGTDINGNRTFWVSTSNKSLPIVYPMDKPDGTTDFVPIRQPHSNAFLSLDKNYYPDLVVTTNDYFEIWTGLGNGFTYNRSIPVPDKTWITGQSLWVDVDMTGNMSLVVPICDINCSRSSIMMYADGWHDLNVKFGGWNFAYGSKSTLRSGDFNMDGYPDLLATLKSSDGETRSFILENVKAWEFDNSNRTFQLWEQNFGNTSMAVFYDFYQDGALDVIVVDHDESKKTHSMRALKNTLDYDANFFKIMVSKDRTHGTNLPGPSIRYEITTEDGEFRRAMAVQLPQSAHFALDLPFTTFGLGRTPSFIELLTIRVKSDLEELHFILD